MAEVPRGPAMSFKSAADTPEEAADEVIALLAQAERGPRFVWQLARRPDAEAYELLATIAGKRERFEEAREWAAHQGLLGSGWS